MYKINYKSYPMYLNLQRYLMLIFFFIFYSNLYAGIAPTFNMNVKNITTISNGTRDSILQFEVYLQQTNYGQPGVDQFEYCSGQFTWLINRAVQNGNLVFGLNNGPDANQLPTNLRPTSFNVDSLSAPAGQLYLRASGNIPNSQINYFISPEYPGTKILTFRLRTSAGRFPVVPLNLRYKFGAGLNTALNYYLPYPEGWDSLKFPVQTTAALTDTISNHFTIENSNYLVGSKISVRLFTLPEGKYNSTFNLLSKRDTVSVYLRNSASPFQLIDSAKGVIDSINYSNIFAFSKPTSGYYYIVIKHYQSVETWSKAGGEYLIKDTSVHNYDFTSNPSQAYFNNMVLKGTKYCLYSGDVDQNGYINLSDVLSIYNDVGGFSIGNVINDLTGDNVVDLNDLLISYYNTNNFIRIRRP